MMTKQTLLGLALGGWFGLAFAQANLSGDDVNRRNSQINRHCSGLIQAKYNYAKLASAEKAVKDREHSAEIQECYRTFAIRSTP